MLAVALTSLNGYSLFTGIIWLGAALAGHDLWAELSTSKRVSSSTDAP
jgi:hypothetical protein